MRMEQKKQHTIIDLFAGAGGLSEGFIQAGFHPIAHVEMDHYACDTLRTRAAFHYLKANDQLEIYETYLKNKRTRKWSVVVESSSSIHNTLCDSSHNWRKYHKWYF